MLTLHSAGSSQVKTTGQRSAVTYYKVRRGDSLSAIAQRFAVRTQHLKQWNPSLGRTLKAGQTLTLHLKRR
ncbi:Membrane-bound lytic murein transglycosylase D precursor [compost metagenome]